MNPRLPLFAFLFAGAAACFAPAALAFQDTSTTATQPASPPREEGTEDHAGLRQDAHEAGQEIKEGAHEVGQAVRNGAHHVGAAVHRTAHWRRYHRCTRWRHHHCTRWVRRHDT
jgi:hypothetical protein